MIAGIDVGTTGCKCTVCDVDGTILAECYDEYFTDVQGSYGSLQPEVVWHSVKKVLASAAKGLPLQAIGITSFGEAPVLLDENDRPVMPSILYTDTRGQAECEELVEKIGANRIAQLTGTAPHSMYSICKLMWVFRNQPELSKKVSKIFLFADYIVYMLSGVAQMDYSLAARTMAFDVYKRDWCDEILEQAGIEKSKFPPTVPSGTKAGVIRQSVAEELGLSPEVMVVTGCHDQVAASLGTGIMKDGMAVDGTGTVECITSMFSRKPDTAKLQKSNYAVVPYVLPDSYVCYAFSFTGGALLKWYRDQFGLLETIVAKQCGMNFYEHMNQKLGDVPSGLLVLPYFAGAATPYMDIDAKGAILGLSLDTTAEEIYRALMEGVTYEMLLNLERLQEAGVYINELRATGGGATSEVWLQMKADILNCKIITLGNAQSGTLGCIMLAGVACGLYENIQQAQKKLVKLGKEYYPRSEQHEIYMHYYNVYKKIYAATKSIGI